MRLARHRRIAILIPSASRCVGINAAAYLGATLTFTPLITGYWQVATSCSVTVTDTTTNQYWGGTGNAGPEDLISAAVTFAPGPIITGADEIPGQSDAIYTVVASVQPVDLAYDVTVNNFLNSGAGRSRQRITRSTAQPRRRIPGLPPPMRFWSRPRLIG